MVKIDSDLATFQLNQSKLNGKLERAQGIEKAEKAEYNKRLKEACDGFEEIFVHKLIQVMRSSTEKESLLSGGRGEEIFQDMLDENYASLITKSRALGLSDLIFEQTKKN